jgi:SAM-dependent methyltransferase
MPQELNCPYTNHYARMGNVLPDWEAPAPVWRLDPNQMQWLPADRDARILDAGCGWGFLLCALWRAGYRNLVGLDMDSGQVKSARSASAGRIPIHCSRAATFLWDSPAAYDAILLMDVIEHVPSGDSADLLAAIYSALRPGGRLVVRTPNMASLAASYSRYMDVTHVAGFTEWSLVQLLESAGFGRIALTEDDRGWNSRQWRPWAPLRGLAVRSLLNYLFHRLIYAARAQQPLPTRFGFNLEAVAWK